MEEGDEGALVDEVEISNHVDFESNPPLELVPCKQNLNLENEQDQEPPVIKQNGEHHFQGCPFQSYIKAQSMKGVHSAVPDDSENIPEARIQQNGSPKGRIVPLNTAPAEVDIPFPEPELKSTSEGSELPMSQPSSATGMSPRKMTPTTPSQEIHFNIPFCGVDEPYIILNSQERSPDATYEQNAHVEMKEKSPAQIELGEWDAIGIR